MVLLGEQMDDDELQDLFDEYDPEMTGRMVRVQHYVLVYMWYWKIECICGTGIECICGTGRLSVYVVLED